MSDLAVFAYASLASPESASRTLGRPAGPAGLATLRGWSRTWTLARDNASSEKTFARPDGSLPRFCLGLNLEPHGRLGAPNGLLLALEEAELERLDRREIRYRRVDVTEAVRTGRAALPFTRVFAYVARPEHHHPTPPADSIVVAAYPRTVEAAFARLGPRQLALYRETTEPPPVEVTAARLVGDRIPPGNPREW